MSSLLASAYETAKPAKKELFDVSKITDALMAEPLNLDISQIIHTPQTVIVKKSRDEYMNERIASVIKSKFDVDIICKHDMLIFAGAESVI